MQFQSTEAFETVCAGCNTPYCNPDAEESESNSMLDDEYVKFGRTVADVISHRGEETDVALDSNIGFILLDKEQRQGLRAFSKPERFVYAVQGMSREVNNGGFDQFFSNSSGELAYDLVPALEAMGLKKNLVIAQKALERFGKPRSLRDSTRWKHIAKITKDGEVRLWEDLDNAFYENPEDIEKKILSSIIKNIDSFTS